MDKDSGVLLPIFSLPGKYGIGTIGEYAYKFIDFLAKAGFSYWEILPLNPINNDNSPYSTSDVFALNYLYIDLEELIKEGLLSSRDLKDVDFGKNSKKIDYSLLFKNRKEVLFKAYRRDKNKDKLVKEAVKNNDLKDYAIYMTLKELNNYKPRYDRKLEDRFFSNEVEQFVMKEETKLFDYYLWTQAKFLIQWDKLHKYAKSKGISLIGDMPHFLSYDSTQMYIHPELFLVDKRNQIKFVSGFPPDEFSKVGQKWGNPLYDWEYMKQDNYKWRDRRISYGFKLYDYVKLSHFRAFYQTYAIPFRAVNAKHGEYIQSPKEDFFKDKLNMKLIASDLGKNDEAVEKFVSTLPFPSLRTIILPFVEKNIRNFEKNLPSNLPINSYSYVGNHDNNPLMQTFYSFYKNEFNNCKHIISEESKKLKIEYYEEDKSIKYHAFKIIELLFASNASHIILQFQDLLLTRDAYRINIPGKVSEDNWSYRIMSNDINDRLAQKFKELNLKYNRFKK